jgi:hypothetical protein
MICNVNIAGLCKDCEASRGGIVEVYAANYGDVTPTVSASTETITSLTVASGASFYKYEFRKGTGSMTSTLTIDSANGTNYVATELVLQFSRMETRKRIEMAALAVGELVFIVKDANGKYWYLGFDEPVTASAGTGQTGQAIGDGNFYSITLLDNANTFPYEVLPSVVEGLNATCPEERQQNNG